METAIRKRSESPEGLLESQYPTELNYLLDEEPHFHLDDLLEEEAEVPSTLDLLLEEETEVPSAIDLLLEESDAPQILDELLEETERPRKKSIMKSFKTEETRKNIQSYLLSLVKSTFTPANIGRALFMSAACGVVLFLSGGGSIGVLLETLYSLGITSVPYFLKGVLGNAAFTAVSGMSITAAVNFLQKMPGGNVLNRKIPETVVTRWSERLGLSLTSQTTVADVIKATAVTSTSIYMGGLTSFLVCSSVSKGVELSGKSAKLAATYSKVAAERVAQFPVKVFEKLSEPTSDKLDIPGMISEEEEEILEAIGEEVEVGVSDQKIVDSPVMEAMAWGRVAALSAGLATATVALATGTVDASSLSSAVAEIASSGWASGVELAASSPAASKVILNIVTSAGIRKVAGTLGLTPEQEEMFKNLEQKYRKGKKPGTLIKIVHLLTKGKIHGDQLKKLSKGELKLIASERGIKVPPNIPVAKLREIIRESEAKSLADLQASLQTILTNSLMAGLGSSLTSVVSDFLQQENLRVTDLGGETVEAPKAEDPSMEEWERLTRRKEELREMFDKQKVIEEERLSLRKEELKELFASRKDLEERLATEADKRRAAMDEEFARKKAILKNLRDVKSSKPKVHGPKVPAFMKEDHARARRALREYSKINQDAMKANVFVVQPEVVDPVTGEIKAPEVRVGVPYEMPVMNPRIAKELESFEFDPLMVTLGKKAAVQASSFIGMGIINQVNTALEISDLARRAYRLEQIITGISLGETPEITEFEALPRIPGPQEIVDRLWKTDSTNMAKIISNAISSKMNGELEEGQFFTYIGRQILWGEKASTGTGITDWMLESIGRSIYDSVMTGSTTQTAYI